jgi:predicted nucleic acid-binding protein
MALKNGHKLLNIYLAELESNVERDGTIISTQILKRTLGLKKKNGFSFYNIINMGTSGLKLQRLFRDELITVLRITGILQ